MRIAVAAVNFGCGFQGLVFNRLKKLLQPGQTLVECATIGRPEIAQPRLEKVLEGDPRPVALIGICIRPAPEIVHAYQAAHVPIVLIDEAIEGASTVASDNFRGGYVAGEYLARQGRKQFAVVAGRTQVAGGYNALQRLNGFKKALADARLGFSDRNVVEVVNYSHNEGAEAMASFVRDGLDLDAVFCAAGDICAGGMLAAARERRVKIPEQVAVVGYDDNALASISSPPLTTIRQQLEEIAATALRMATVETAAILDRPRTVLQPPELVIRRSA